MTARPIALLALSAVAVAVVGCSGEDAKPTPNPPKAGFTELSDKDYSACTDFAQWHKDGRDHVEIANLTNDHLAGSQNANLVAAAEGLDRTSKLNNSVWTMAADTFAGTCFSSGWNG